MVELLVPNRSQSLRVAECGAVSALSRTWADPRSARAHPLDQPRSKHRDTDQADDADQQRREQAERERSQTDVTHTGEQRRQPAHQAEFELARFETIPSLSTEKLQQLDQLNQLDGLDDWINSPNDLDGFFGSRFARLPSQTFHVATSRRSVDGLRDPGPFCRSYEGPDSGALRGCSHR